MSSATNKQSSKPGQPGFAVAPNNQAILLDKLNRRSTPDSEALASSDDEPEHHRQDPPQPIGQAHKPVRRASWLNDTSSPLAKPRKGSFASSTMSPTASHPSTPSADPGASVWGSHQPSALGRAPPSTTFPWGTGIWNSNADRKDLPSRLSEVLPSPTSTLPPGSAGTSFFGPDHGLGQTSPGPREHGTNSQIPFAIPLHPTPKTYRSQSYSVGQMDPDTNPASGMNSAAMLSRSRAHPNSGLQHRPSRPSMLSEMSNDAGLLGKVKEVEDDDEESAPESMQSSLHQSAEAKQIEMLTRENAMLRQQQQYQSNRIRPRASTGASYGLGNGYSLRETVPEESDYAIDELEESNDPEAATKRALGRRMSEYGAGFSRAPYENRKLENVKKAFWHSSLGFDSPDGQQSRRHSFADLPQRQASISSLNDSMSQLETPTPTGDGQQSSDYMGYSENNAYASPHGKSYS